MGQELQVQDGLLENDALPEGEKVEATDPGQLEGMAKGGKTKHEPPPESPRWNEVYRKSKELERTVGELKSSTAEKDSLIKQMQDHNKQLADAIKEIQQKSEKQDEADEAGVLAELGVVLTDLQTKQSEAAGENDIKKVLEIQRKIDEVREELLTAKLSPKVGKEKPEDISKKVTAELATQKIVEAQGVIFTEEPWLNPKGKDYDPVLAGAAATLDAQLMKDPTWASLPVIDQFREVSRRVKERFGIETEKVEKAPKNRSRMPGVAPIVTGGGDDRGTVTLSPEQRKVARNLFPNEADPEATYASQLKLMAKGRER